MNLNNNRIDILFVLIDNGLTLDNSSVYQSQVGDQIIHLNKIGYKVGLLCLFNDEKKFNLLISEKFETLGISIFKIESKKSFLRNIINIVISGSKLKKNNSIFQFYVRGIWGGLSAILINIFYYKKTEIIYDVRGDLRDELDSTRVNFIKKIFYLTLEFICVKYSRKILTVSSSLANNIKKRYRINSVDIIPCCLNFSKFQHDELVLNEFRDKLNLKPENIVFIYSGGLSHYQQVPQMLKLWSNFLDDPDIKFFLLTNDDPHTYPGSLEYAKLFSSRLIHLSVPRDFVSIYLNIADFAFLLREDRTLNNVASPVKFAEYISCGLNIITSPNIGDISNQVIENSIGFLIKPNFSNLDLLNLKKYVNKVKNSRSVSNKEFIKQYAQLNYDWSAFNETFIKIYKTN